MTIRRKASSNDPRVNKQAGGLQQAAPDNAASPRRSGVADPNHQAGAGHMPQRISQQLAQNIPSDPDPDDPVSP